MLFHFYCTNNQVLEKLEGLQDGQDKSVVIYTEGKITLDLLQNKFKQNRLIELVRNKIILRAHLKCIMYFGWVKGQAGIEGNELVERLATGHVGIEGNELVDRLATGQARI